jgi:hypothetical protein
MNTEKLKQGGIATGIHGHDGTCCSVPHGLMGTAYGSRGTMKPIDRSKRARKTSEIFTPPGLVNEMLDKLVYYSNGMMGEDKTFCDPACGDGNILVEVLKRKLSWGHRPIKALETIYGCDIMADNIMHCRYRLLSIVKEQGVDLTAEVIETVLTRIVWVNMKSKRHPKGSLSYDFSFNGSNLKGTNAVSSWVDYMRNPESVREKALMDKAVRDDPT